MPRLYLWDRETWPSFTYDAGELLEPLGQARRKQGVLGSSMGQIGFAERTEAYLDTLTTDALETSRIEGEHLDYAAVRSSVAQRLGIPNAALATYDAKAAGVAEMTLDATRNYAQPLTPERIFRWHTGLFPDGRSEGHKILVGSWRPGAVGVYTYARAGTPPVTNFVGPPSDRVPAEMETFLKWFNGTPADDGLVRSALAHLWFLTIHPFEDGNGRIARAIADMALAQDEHAEQRFFSMSRQIRIEQNSYYEVLENTQTGNMNVTEWIIWFLRCLANAIDSATTTLQNVLRAGAFWSAHSSYSFNERQRKVLTRVFHGFEGKLNTRNWARLGGTSKDTAQRDLADLLGKGLLTVHAAGRSTYYELVEP